MKKEIVIDIAPDGKTSALHMDEFPLTFLGQMEIRRASSIEFHQASQSFHVAVDPSRSVLQKARLAAFPDSPYIPPEAAGFDGYDEARAFEVDWLQECAKIGIDPLSPPGVRIAARLRVERKQSSTAA